MNDAGNLAHRPVASSADVREALPEFGRTARLLYDDLKSIMGAA